MNDIEKEFYDKFVIIDDHIRVGKEKKPCIYFTETPAEDIQIFIDKKIDEVRSKSYEEGYGAGEDNYKEDIKPLIKALKDILYWKNKADTTSGMLLSSHHEKSDECGEIMKNYMESFKKAEDILSIQEDKK